MFCAKVVLYCNDIKFIAMALSSNRAKKFSKKLNFFLINYNQ